MNLFTWCNPGRANDNNSDTNFIRKTRYSTCDECGPNKAVQARMTRPRILEWDRSVIVKVTVKQDRILPHLSILSSRMMRVHNTKCYKCNEDTVEPL